MHVSFFTLTRKNDKVKWKEVTKKLLCAYMTRSKRFRGQNDIEYSMNNVMDKVLSRLDGSTLPKHLIGLSEEEKYAFALLSHDFTL